MGGGGGGVVKGLGYTKFKIRQIRSPDCQTKYTVSHFLLECNKYNIEKGSCWQNLPVWENFFATSRRLATHWNGLPWAGRDVRRLGVGGSRASAVSTVRVRDG